jgi:transcriptional regulator with XRE-family HTH domain
MPSQLGQELRIIRELAGLSGRQLAKATGTSQSFISRVEIGTRALSDRELHTWATATGADEDTLRHLRSLNRAAHTTDPGYTLLRNVETLAESIHVFDPAGIPALLWTPMYTRQALQTAQNPDRHAAFAEDLPRRQQPLLTGSKNYAFIFTQRAVPRPTTSANRGLIGRILSLEGMAKVTVIADRCPLLDLAKTGFTIYDGLSENDDTPTVGITTLYTEIVVTAASHVAQYQTMFEQLAAHATEISWPPLSPQASPARNTYG